MERFCRGEQKAASAGRLEELVLSVFLLSLAVLVSLFSLTGSLGFIVIPPISWDFPDFPQTPNDKKAKLLGKVCKEIDSPETESRISGYKGTARAVLVSERDSISHVTGIFTFYN